MESYKSELLQPVLFFEKLGGKKFRMNRKLVLYGVNIVVSEMRKLLIPDSESKIDPAEHQSADNNPTINVVKRSYP